MKLRKLRVLQSSKPKQKIFLFGDKSIWVGQIIELKVVRMVPIDGVGKTKYRMGWVLGADRVIGYPPYGTERHPINKAAIEQAKQVDEIFELQRMANMQQHSKDQLTAGLEPTQCDSGKKPD